MKKKSSFPLQKKGKTITLSPAQHATSMSQRFKGLMGVSPEDFQYALVFHLEEDGILNASIHMLFMKMPIDVMWLDAKQRIIDVKEGARPWSLNHSPSRPARYIIELPTGSIQATGPKTGDVVKWTQK